MNDEIPKAAPEDVEESAADRLRAALKSGAKAVNVLPADVVAVADKVQPHDDKTAALRKGSASVLTPSRSPEKPVMVVSADLKHLLARAGV